MVEAAARRERVEVARPLMQKGSYNDARRQLRKAVEADPKNADAALLLAECYRRTGKIEKALEAVSGHDDDVRVLATRGELLLDTGDDAAAKAALDAHRLGYITRVVEDATRGVELEKGDTVRALSEMSDKGIRIIKSAHVI